MRGLETGVVTQIRSHSNGRNTSLIAFLYSSSALYRRVGGVVGWGGVAISWEAVWSCLAGSRVGDSRLMWGKEERCYLLWRIEKGLASRAAVPRSAHYPARNQRIHSASLGYVTCKVHGMMTVRIIGLPFTVIYKTSRHVTKLPTVVP